MTPKFKYDPQQHCLREVVSKPVWDSERYQSRKHYIKEYGDYLENLALPRVIPCAPWLKWAEGEFVEGVDFEVLSDFAFPITKPPRTFTLAEVLEIFQDAYRLGMTYTMAENGTHVDPLSTERQQYFKTRFNVESTPQTPK